MIEKDDRSHFGGAIIKSVGLCLGASYPTELDETVEEQAEIDIETGIESSLTDLLATMGVEGTVECNVDIDSEPLTWPSSKLIQFLELEIDSLEQLVFPNTLSYVRSSSMAQVKDYFEELNKGIWASGYTVL